MKDQMDPVDGALESLGGRQWPGDYHNHQLKDKIMQELQTKRSSSRLGRRGALVASLLFLVLGTAGFAAAGGFELVRGWFITVEVNGVPVDIDEADIDVQTDGDTVTLTIDSADIDTGGEEGEAVITVIATSEEDAGTVNADGSAAEVKAINVQVNDKDTEEDD